MSYTLRFVFSGPTVYVPSGDGKTFRVLVPDALRPDPESDLSTHVPALLFDRETLVEANGSMVIPFFDGSTERGAIFLHREEIQLDTTPPSQGTSDVLNILRTDSAERLGFDLIPTLQTVCPDCGLIDPKALLDDLPPANVAIRTSFTRGDVFTATLSAQQGDPVLWIIEPNGAPERVGLDAEVDLECEDDVCLLLRNYETGQQRKVRFRPTSGAAGLNLELTNREPSQIFSTAFRTDIEARVDHDFAFNYRLLAETLAPAMQRVPTVPSETPDNISGTTCGGSQSGSQP